jgi:hypothetical protein
MNLLFWKTKPFTVNLLSETWEVIGYLNLRVIPSTGDLIYLENQALYYEVLKHVHYIGDKHNIFLIIKPLADELQSGKNKF